MPFNDPLQISRAFLATLGTRMFVHYADRIPTGGAALIVSNHRSFMDAPLLMAALGRPIRFACHHYMTQVPVLREFVHHLGCLPLQAKGQQQHRFFRRARTLLQQQQAIGVFPEGASPMVRLTDPTQVQPFHPGFAHLALTARVPDLVVLPVAIAPIEEQVYSAIPVRVLSWFDPSEPDFEQDSWHPVVFYRRVNVAIARPHWIPSHHWQHCSRKQAKTQIDELMNYCDSEISALLGDLS
ncbi:1-acyl-sn-glycerol-3-phosphate acyltransferase [Phormidium sp. CCY1219]|nr:1-acyl-sn-glycerol-3-phosphate acyltransferase [Phormidium sp. CCY1219]